MFIIEVRPILLSKPSAPWKRVRLPASAGEYKSAEAALKDWPRLSRVFPGYYEARIVHVTRTVVATIDAQDL